MQVPLLTMFSVSVALFTCKVPSCPFFALLLRVFLKSSYIWQYITLCYREVITQGIWQKLN